MSENYLGIMTRILSPSILWIEREGEIRERDKRERERGRDREGERGRERGREG